MKIKNRLSLYFTAISAFVLLLVQVVICVTFSSFIKSDFYDHLMDRANVASQLYLEADEISPDSLNHVRERYLERLPDEVVRLYDEKNAASFIKDKNQFWPDAIINAVRKRKQLQFTEGNRQTVGIYYNDNQGNFVILVSAIDHQGDKRLKDMIEIMSILLISVTFGLFVISRWFAEKALQPIDKVIGQMRMVRAANLSLRVDEGNGRDEISALAHNFNQLLEHLENAFELQQTFVINASHELRTPITSIIGEIEITLNKIRSTTDYEQVLSSILNDAERLNETIGSLLELANVDMNYTQPVLKAIAIDDLVWELNDYWNDRAGKGHFVVNVLNLPQEHTKLQLLANKSMLTIALNNIIGNAFKFSKNQPVRCDLYADNQSINITITDAGVGIIPEELDKIFDSFYRGTNVKTYQGNGIGLYVTNKIINLFNGKITVSSIPGKSTSVRISFSN
ncbi:ATP-binding protein [Mucilaginibacter sp. X4EP1]|uniref:HAMP domain-containing sensor histidine kinase n=1 Tax=Mucilaginibacter sp. X4EP1 TaxID=2723092 RepID=UPI0021681DE4|nr:ATP-binding protein [Mucilaginibacter sp. X4EP1]MCS3814057.1 signal transduction histidine kinase [Mucilaginibacter sp. X4EP1]